jgi:hypothetical protein
VSYVNIESLTGVSVPGDTNGDGRTDCTDAATLARNFGRSGATLAQGDLDGNGFVDVRDLAVLQPAIDCQRAPSPPPKVAAALIVMPRSEHPAAKVRLGVEHVRRQPKATAVDQVLTNETPTTATTLLRARRSFIGRPRSLTPDP